MMTFGSLFAGIGGFDLGLERAGMRCLWQVEIDPFCTRVLQKHWPEIARFGDIRTVGKHNLPTVDLVCGGFPCQPFSAAGKQRGTADDRHLWPEMLRVVSEIKPRWVIAENVPGLLSIEQGVVFESVLSSLEAEGYEVAPLVIPACGVDAPHRRERVWIVAHASGTGQRPDNGRRPVRDADRDGESQIRRDEQQPGAGGNSADVAHAPGIARGAERGHRTSGGHTMGGDERAGADVADAAIVGSGTRQAECAGQEREPAPVEHSRWATEPDVGRVAHGIPSRVDRLRALGNAVVPQVVEALGRMILAADDR